MALQFEEMVKGKDKNQFLAKVVEISTKLKINPNWLMIVMRNESGINPQAVNKLGGATGLIQFMPATAKGLGTTTAALFKMTGVQQLDYVYKYFKSYAGKINGYKDLYLLTFYPVALSKPLNYAFGSERGAENAKKVRNWNPTFDLNKDGIITKAEFFQYLDQKYGADGTGGKTGKTGKSTKTNTKNTKTNTKPTTSTATPQAGGQMLPLLLGGIAIYAMTKKKK